MVLRRMIIVLAMGTILMGLASATFVWAAPGQSPARQTLPTKTPIIPPTKEEKDKLTPMPTVATPTSGLGTATPVATLVTPPLPQTLPAGGAEFLMFPLALIMVGAMLVLAGWTARYKTKA